MPGLLAILDLVLAQRGSSSGSPLEMAPFLCCCLGIPLSFVLVHLLTIPGMWKVFEKAGQPGWASLVPFYNWAVAARVAGRPEWHGLMTLCIFVNPGWIAAIVFQIMIGIDVSKSFGREGGFGVGLGIPVIGSVFWLILGFSDSEYGGPVYVENQGYRRRRRRRRLDYDDDDDYDDRPRRRRLEDDDDTGVRRSRFDDD